MCASVLSVLSVLCSVLFVVNVEGVSIWRVVQAPYSALGTQLSALSTFHHNPSGLAVLYTTAVVGAYRHSAMIVRLLVRTRTWRRGVVAKHGAPPYRCVVH